MYIDLIIITLKVNDGENCGSDNDCKSGVCNAGLMFKCGLGMIYWEIVKALFLLILMILKNLSF